LTGSGSRGNEHRAHQYHTNRLQANDDGDHKERCHQKIEAAHGDAQRVAELNIEGQQLELFPKQRHDHENDEADASHRVNISGHQGCRLPKEEGF